MPQTRLDPPRHGPAPTGLAPLRFTTLPPPAPPNTAAAGGPLVSLTHPGTSSSALAEIAFHTFGKPTSNGDRPFDPGIAKRGLTWRRKPCRKPCCRSEARIDSTSAIVRDGPSVAPPLLAVGSWTAKSAGSW